MQYFNPRPRKEGDGLRPPNIVQCSHFNPRPRKEGDKYLIGCRKFNSDFNPRPRKEGDSCRILQMDNIRYFNPRPRKEGDKIVYFLGHSDLISIHALVKRATLLRQLDTLTLSISIHALVKRATVEQLFIKAVVVAFQSTPS